MIKKIARKILKREIDELTQKQTYYENKYYDIDRKNTELFEKRADAEAENARLEKEIEEQKRTIDDLKAQNDIMRKYYRIDEEPSDSAKMSILINLRIHELEQQLLTEKMERAKYAQIETISNIMTASLYQRFQYPLAGYGR